MGLPSSSSVSSSPMPVSCSCIVCKNASFYFDRLRGRMIFAVADKDVWSGLDHWLNVESAGNLHSVKAFQELNNVQLVLFELYEGEERVNCAELPQARFMSSSRSTI